MQTCCDEVGQVCQDPRTSFFSSLVGCSRVTSDWSTTNQCCRHRNNLRNASVAIKPLFQNSVPRCDEGVQTVHDRALLTPTPWRKGIRTHLFLLSGTNWPSTWGNGLGAEEQDLGGEVLHMHTI